jgi:hypothetical protein
MHNISLPEFLLATAETIASQAGFKTVEAYLTELVRRDLEQRYHGDPDFLLRQALAENGNSAAVTEEIISRRKQEIEALLLHGLDSGPAVPMTDDDWQEIRLEVHRRRTTQRPS